MPPEPISNEAIHFRPGDLVVYRPNKLIVDKVTAYDFQRLVEGDLYRVIDTASTEHGVYVRVLGQEAHMALSQDAFVRAPEDASWSGSTFEIWHDGTFHLRRILRDGTWLDVKT
jgi:hypothetical protein